MILALFFDDNKDEDDASGKEEKADKSPVEGVE